MNYALPIGTFIFAVVCWVLMFRVVKRDNRGVREAYAYLALQYNLRVTEDVVSAARHPKAMGEYDGRALTIESTKRVRPYPNVAYTNVFASMNATAPYDLSVFPRLPGVALVAKNLLKISADFDKKYVTTGTGDAAALLTPAVQTEMLKAAEKGVWGSLEIENGRVKFSEVGLIHTLARARAYDHVIAAVYGLAKQADSRA